ncbi:hypothetical protein N473_05580 [Pseudoalteromonas luteoviolacea CPMOR-1]|uniref:Glycosyltransferase 2-like domain-containing protein n=1 Tax=Pseudoalteromonas luteoviolacea CPMOR-1 TaxID=1365248 RepID=A0A167HJV1_9GAMM|nr:hypothetical protein N473_05580 [Pseudoalteromonas luteoviolacea CPMOR-1]
MSVVIPHYNNHDALSRALQSVLQQSFEVSEILVVDDCSLDQLKLDEVCGGFDTDKIKLLKHEVNRNGSAARNTGILASSGDYIALLDCDDFWMPNYIGTCIENIQALKCDGLYANLNVWHDVEGNQKTKYSSRDMSKGETPTEFILGSGFAQTSSFFLSAHSAKAVLFDEQLRRHQDYDFFIRYSNQFEFKHHDIDDVATLWEINQPRNVNFESCIVFYEKHKDDLTGLTRSNYLLKMLYATHYNNADPKYSNYYKQELSLPKEGLSKAFLLSKLPAAAWKFVVTLQAKRKSGA